jgi:hypothetical protein
MISNTPLSPMPATWDYVNSLAITVNRPASKVWPFFFGTKKDIWTRSAYRTIAGEPDQIGEIFMHEYVVLGAPLYFFYEAVRVIPERELALKITFQRQAAGSRELIGYDVINVNEIAGRTTVVLQQLIAFPTDIPQSTLALETEKHNQFLTDILQGLKQMVEATD